MATRESGGGGEGEVRDFKISILILLQTRSIVNLTFGMWT